MRDTGNQLDKKEHVFSVEPVTTDKTHSYDEAVDLTGNGWYNVGLLAVLSVAITAMALDMFGFSVVVAGAGCDFQLTLNQKSIMISMPFLGPIIMSYPWGYLSDTRGRKWSLVVAMAGSYIATTVSAFSPNWITLAALKFISSGFCSCAQSATYTLVGESCSPRVRTSYMLVMTSCLMTSAGIWFTIGYLTLSLDFSYNLGLVSFTPWRLLVILLALPLGISCLLLKFFHESPKFLVNQGMETEALNALHNIWKRNGCPNGNFPVKKLVLEENSSPRRRDMPLLRSMMEQTLPLFKYPLVLRTMQLYYITFVIFAVNNSYLMWYPFVADTFFGGAGASPAGGQSRGLCEMMTQIGTRNATEIACTSSIELKTVYSSLAYASLFTGANLIMSQVSSHKKLLIIIILLSSCASGIATTLITGIASFAFFIVFLTTGLCIGLVWAYFNELYPTSHRGMVACLAVMVARTCALSGINVVGSYFISHCSGTFYVSCGLVLSAVVMALFLPSDRPTKKV